MEINFKFTPKKLTPEGLVEEFTKNAKKAIKKHFKLKTNQINK